MAKKIPFKQCVCAEYTNTPVATEAIMNEALERIFGEYYSSKELPAINWEEFKRGFKEELEHGCRGPVTNVTCDNPEATAKIVLAHLNEEPDYYTRHDLGVSPNLKLEGPTTKEKFTEAVHVARAKPLVDWRTLNSEFTRIMNDKNYGRP